jgi:hypothetical protein
MPGNRPFAPVGLSSTASVRGPQGSCHDNSSTASPSNSRRASSRTSGTPPKSTGAMHSHVRLRAATRHASTLANRSDRSDSPPGLVPSTVSASHGPYAPTMFGRISIRGAAGAKQAVLAGFSCAVSAATAPPQAQPPTPAAARPSRNARRSKSELGVMVDLRGDLPRGLGVAGTVGDCFGVTPLSLSLTNGRTSIQEAMP